MPIGLSLLRSLSIYMYAAETWSHGWLTSFGNIMLIQWKNSTTPMTMNVDVHSWFLRTTLGCDHWCCFTLSRQHNILLLLMWKSNLLFFYYSVFSHYQTLVACSSCQTMLCQPTDGKARLTKGYLIMAKNEALLKIVYYYVSSMWGDRPQEVSMNTICPCILISVAFEF